MLPLGHLLICINYPHLYSVLLQSPRVKRIPDRLIDRRAAWGVYLVQLMFLLRLRRWNPARRKKSAVARAAVRRRVLHSVSPHLRQRAPLHDGPHILGRDRREPAFSRSATPSAPGPDALLLTQYLIPQRGILPVLYSCGAALSRNSPHECSGQWAVFQVILKAMTCG